MRVIPASSQAGGYADRLTGPNAKNRFTHSARTCVKLGMDVGNQWNCAAIILVSSGLSEALPRFAEPSPSYDHDAGR
jgi:hypothetical protein